MTSVAQRLRAGFQRRLLLDQTNARTTAIVREQFGRATVRPLLTNLHVNRVPVDVRSVSISPRSAASTWQASIRAREPSRSPDSVSIATDEMTKVSSEPPTALVTSQQRSVGKRTPLAWNLGTYPSGTEARGGATWASSVSLVGPVLPLCFADVHFAYSGGGQAQGGDSGAPFYLPVTGGVSIRGMVLGHSNVNNDSFDHKWSTIRDTFVVSIVTA
jgi:hypothetical protein